MRAAPIAWAVLGFTVVVMLLTGVLKLLIAGADEAVPADMEVGAADLVWSSVILGFALIGSLVASRRPGNAIGWLFCGGAVAFGLSGLAESYAIYTLFAHPGSLLGGGETMAWLSAWVWVPGGVALVTLFPLLFPTGALLSSRWRPVAAVAIAGGAILSVGTAFSPGRFDDLPQVTNPYAVEGALGDVLRACLGLGWLLLVIALIASATSLVVRFRRARGIERLQLKWVATAGVFLVASFLLWQIWEGLAALGMLTMALAAGIAILRYRLYDIDVVINRTLVYGALTGTLVGAYVASVLLLQLALSPLTSESDLAIAGSTLLVAALFGPARHRIQGLVDRRFYRRKYDAARTVEAFGARLRDEVDLAAVGADLRSVVTETMQPAHVSLWLRSGGARG